MAMGHAITRCSNRSTCLHSGTRAEALRLRQRHCCSSAEGDPIMASQERTPKGMPLSLAPGAGGKKFRAYDKATGRVLWETELPAGTTGAPMTYMFRGQTVRGCRYRIARAPGRIRCVEPAVIRSERPHFLSCGAPVPDEPRNSVWPLGSVRSRPFARREPSFD